MTLFYVLSLGEFIGQEGINISMESFSELFHNVTSKHQRRMKFSIITKGEMEDYINQRAQYFQIESALEIIPWTDQEKIEQKYQESAVMLLPSRENISKLISEAFSFGLPVICFDHPELFETVDQTCGMLIDMEHDQASIEEFSEKLSILYFDPEVRKILKKGAQQKYEELFSWGFSKSKDKAESYS